MKKLHILFILLVGLFFTFSCKDDLEVVVPDNAVVPVLTSSSAGGTFVLEKVNENETFGTFEWSNADFKLPVNVSIQYSLEVDVKGGDFVGRKTIASGITSPFTITVGNFNKGLLGAGFEDGKTYEVSVRVVGGNYLGSEPISMTVTPYFDAEPYSVIGSAVGGWNPENDKFMAYDKATNTYSITLDMTPGEFKFRAPKVDASNPWKVNLGLVGDTELIEDGEDIELKQDGANILTKGGNFTITLDVAKATFTIVKNAASQITDWTGVVLDAVGTGISIDNPNATADGSSWNWGNVLLADNNGVPSAEAGVYTWTWKGIILEANEGFKLRTQNGVAGINSISFDVGYNNVDLANSSSKVADSDGNISVTEKGLFDISLIIDAINGDVKKVVVADPAPLYPAELFMIGDGVNDWEWSNTDLPMVPVHSHPNLFWKIVWLKATGAFKFAPQKAWQNDFGYAEDLGNGEFSKGTTDIPVPGTAGFYMVVVDLEAEKISIADPKVYLIGNTVGSWDTGNAEALFTVDNANEKITITKTLAADELRMYAWHAYFTDWWQSEFMIFDGTIVPRGTGGDQERVTITGGATTIDLNFTTMTGTITP